MAHCPSYIARTHIAIIPDIDRIYTFLSAMLIGTSVAFTLHKKNEAIVMSWMLAALGSASFIVHTIICSIARFRKVTCNTLFDKVVPSFYVSHFHLPTIETNR